MRNIKTKDFVQIGICQGGGVEKIWFEILSIDRGGTFLGRCANVPTMISGIKYNDTHRYSITEALKVILEQENVQITYTTIGAGCNYLIENDRPVQNKNDGPYYLKAGHADSKQKAIEQSLRDVAAIKTGFAASLN